MSTFKVWVINKLFVHRMPGGVCVCMLHRCEGGGCEGREVVVGRWENQNSREVLQKQYFANSSALMPAEEATEMHIKNKHSWASLVAQWLRVCLPMQGTRVRALVWEDPTCRGATGPVSHNY